MNVIFRNKNLIWKTFISLRITVWLICNNNYQKLVITKIKNKKEDLIQS